MRIAQQLYEDGAITYMRTDGVQMDGSAISAARKAIADRYDGAFLPEKPRQYQTKAKNAQEAHEAIRPTDFNRDRAGSRSRETLRPCLQTGARKPDGFGAAGTDDHRSARWHWPDRFACDRAGRDLSWLSDAV